MNWIILRCWGANTVAVLCSLERAGYEGQVWSPIVEGGARCGRSRSRKPESEPEPLLPSYIFAHADRLGDLMQEQRSPTSSHPPFWVMLQNGRVATVKDSQIDPLRVAENRVKPKSNHPAFLPGTIVKTSEAGFEGLKGKVLSSRGKWSFVEFEGFLLPIKISTFLLLRDER